MLITAPQAHAAVHAEWMNAPEVKLTTEVLFEVAKNSFYGFKKEFKAQQDAKKAEQKQRNARATTWAQQRAAVRFCAESATP